MEIFGVALKIKLKQWIMANQENIEKIKWK